MDKLQCTNCGGNINPSTYVCEYCGTKYMRPKWSVPAEPLIIVERQGVHTLDAKVRVDSDMISMIGKEDTSKICMERLVNCIAREITPFMEVYIEDDVNRMDQVVSARLRVVEPSYRFKGWRNERYY